MNNMGVVNGPMLCYSATANGNIPNRHDMKGICTMKKVREGFALENDVDIAAEDKLNSNLEGDSEVVTVDEVDILPKEQKIDEEAPASAEEGMADQFSVDEEKRQRNIADVVKVLAQSLDKDSEMALNIETEIGEILLLSPDEPFRKMMDEVLNDPKLTTHEKITEMQRIVSMRSEDREKYSTVVKDVQSSKAKSFRFCLGTFGEWFVLCGVVVVVGGLACTPGGREILKLGAQYIVKRAA